MELPFSRSTYLSQSQSASTRLIHSGFDPSFDSVESICGSCSFFQPFVNDLLDHCRSWSKLVWRVAGNDSGNRSADKFWIWTTGTRQFLNARDCLVRFGGFWRAIVAGAIAYFDSTCSNFCDFRDRFWACPGLNCGNYGDFEGLGVVQINENGYDPITESQTRIEFKIDLNWYWFGLILTLIWNMDGSLTIDLQCSFWRWFVILALKMCAQDWFWRWSIRAGHQHCYGYQCCKYFYWIGISIK